MNEFLLDQALGPIEESHLSLIEFWDREFFSRPWDKQSWESTRKNSENYFLLAKYGDELKKRHVRKDDPFAFLLFLQIIPDNSFELLKFLVHPAWHGRGIGTKFLQEALNNLADQKMGINKIFLEVSVDNIQAIRCYERCGFEILARRKNYYGDGGDAFSMRLLIPAFGH